MTEPSPPSGLSSGVASGRDDPVRGALDHRHVRAVAIVLAVLLTAAVVVERSSALLDPPPERSVPRSDQ